MGTTSAGSYRVERESGRVRVVIERRRKPWAWLVPIAMIVLPAISFVGSMPAEFLSGNPLRMLALAALWTITPHGVGFLACGAIAVIAFWQRLVRREILEFGPTELRIRQVVLGPLARRKRYRLAELSLPRIARGEHAELQLVFTYRGRAVRVARELPAEQTEKLFAEIRDCFGGLQQAA